jgi:hypothetical protein
MIITNEPYKITKIPSIARLLDGFERGKIEKIL